MNEEMSILGYLHFVRKNCTKKSWIKLINSRPEYLNFFLYFEFDTIFEYLENFEFEFQQKITFIDHCKCKKYNDLYFHSVIFLLLNHGLSDSEISSILYPYIDPKVRNNNLTYRYYYENMNDYFINELFHKINISIENEMNL